MENPLSNIELSCSYLSVIQKEMKYHGRVKPYTERGISRVSCIKCGQPSKYQWSICSNKNRNLAVCIGCDIELNKIFLNFANFSNKKELLQTYEESKKNI